jgi:two-component system phosphate regulon sensor histidine kinase PhoR
MTPAWADATPEGTYDLPLPPAVSRSAAPTRGRTAHVWRGRAGRPEAPHVGFPLPLLTGNIVWFCRLRWVVLGMLLGLGLLGFLPEVSAWIGWRTQRLWPFAAAGVLAAANLGFLAHAARLHRVRPPASAARGAALNLWGQIVLDLLVLTAVVHFVGSLETFIPFAYLFHIVLGCIFLSRRESLAVTVLAAALYTGCVLVERLGWLAPAGFYADPVLRGHFEQTPHAAGFNIAVAVGIWLAVWYLASHLAMLVRVRDADLADANRRLIEMQEERTRHMLRTTHELKAPLAAVHQNVQLLQKGYCGALSPEAAEVLERVAARCRRLTHEIQEMLELANLRSAHSAPLDRTPLDLASVAGWAVAQVQTAADLRGIVVDRDLRSAPVTGVEEHLRTLFVNLLANAVAYSNDGGSVKVTCALGPAGAPVATVEDHGIGIPPEKLPHVFEEYYRTEEAVRHNKESSGLGLAIVRQVALSHRIRVRVRSRPGAGTTVTLTFPEAVGN